MKVDVSSAVAWVRNHTLPDQGVVVSTLKRQPYPEVTGYLIPSLLEAGAADLAEAYGRWLLTIQRPDGSFADPDGSEGFAFDTGQIVRGLLALAPKNAGCAEAARRAVEWLIRMSSSAGRLPVPSAPDAWSMGSRGSIPEAVHLYCLPPIAAAARLFDESRWSRFVARSLDWYLANTAVSDFARPNQLTHLFGYVQEALVDLGAHDAALPGIRALARAQSDNGAVPAYHDAAWVCAPGQFQAAICFEKTGDRERARRAVAFMNGFVNGSGGFFGSFGVGAEYFPNEEISWTAKFQLDALRLLARPSTTTEKTTPVPPAPERSAPPSATISSGRAAPVGSNGSAPAAPRSQAVVALAEKPAATATSAKDSKPLSLDSNLPPDEWHASIVAGASAEMLAAQVTRDQAPRWIEPILVETTPGEKILELGGGTGELSAHLARVGRQTTVVDFSKKSLAFAEQVFRCSGVEGAFVEANVLKRLPFDDAAFDCVWSSGLLEHFDDDEMQHIVDESARVSRGKVIALVPNAASLPYRIGKTDQERGGRWTWGREDPKQSLREVFYRAGLGRIREYSIAPEHALEFLDTPELAPVRAAFAHFYETLTIEQLNALNQGYLLVTVGEVKARKIERPGADREKRDGRGIEPPLTFECPSAAVAYTPPVGRTRRLAVVPNDPVKAYEDAGYPDLTSYFNPGGLFAEVYCLSPHEPIDTTKYGMRIIPTPIAQFADRVRELGIDVVRAYDIPAGAIACAQKVPGVPVVVSVHDTDPRRFTKPLPAADLFLSISEATEQALMERGADPRRIRRFANRVDIEVFRPMDDPARRRDFEARFPGRFRVLHVGRRTEQKNLETTIAALGRLGPDYTGIFVGKGDAAPYAKLAEAAGCADRIHFLDAVPNAELPYYYSFADVFCTPSLWEGFGIVFIEAMASGAVVVTSDIKPMSEYIVHEESGLLVADYRDAGALARAVKRGAENAEIRRKLKAGARKAAMPFSKSAVDALEKRIYEDLLRAADAKRRGLATVAMPIMPAAAEEQAQPVSISTIVKRRSEAAPRFHLLTRDLAADWDRVVAASPDAWFFHAFAEQVLHERAWNVQTLSFLLEWHGEIVGVCPLHRWRWDPATLWSQAMGTGGPVIDGRLEGDDRAEVERLLFGVVREMCDGRMTKAVRVSLPPLSRTARSLWGRDESPLRLFGFQDESTTTSVLDLSGDLDKVFGGFCADYRNRIRKAEREGVVVFEATGPGAVDDYYKLHVETYTRTGVQPHPRAYFQEIFDRFVVGGQAVWLMAKFDNHVISAMNVARHGDSSLFWTGASSAEGLKRSAPKLLMWEHLKRAKAAGVLWHETGEVFPEAKGDKLAGLSLFKARFGGRLVPFHKGILKA